MMDKKTYFLSAVIVALIIPLFLAWIYFSVLSRTNQRGKYLSRVEGKNEVLLFGNYEFESIKFFTSDKDYVDGNKLDFIVRNASDNEETVFYSLSLKDIGITEESNVKNIKWRLLSYSESDNRYNLIKNGSFEDFISDGKLIDGKELSYMGTDKYMLYYYVTENEELPIDIEGKIILE